MSSHFILLWRGTTFPSRCILSTHRNGTWRPVPLWPQGLRSTTLRQHIFPQWFFLLSPASFQRLITLRSESACCCFFKKVEVRVGYKLTVTQRSPTGPLLVVLVLDMHHSLNTHINKRHSFLWLPTLTPLKTDITGSPGKCISIVKAAAFELLSSHVCEKRSK